MIPMNENSFFCVFESGSPGFRGNDFQQLGEISFFDADEIFLLRDSFSDF